MVQSLRISVNKVVLMFVCADFMFFTAAGFLTPIIAVYFTDHIKGGSLAVAGFATTVFWVVKSAVQIPVSLYADSKKGECDDFAIMMWGNVIAAVVPLLYYFFATEVWHVYLFETIRGIGYALLTPTYLAIFTRHIDRYKENVEWTLHSNAVGLGFAAAAALGGVIAERFGFGAIFLLVSALTFMSPIMLLVIRDRLTCAVGDVPLGARIAREKTVIHHS